MRKTATGALIAAPILGGLACIVGFALFLGAVMSSGTGTSTDSSQGSCSVEIENAGPVSTLDAEQARNAAIIAAVGRQMDLGGQGVVVALATALQESMLRNLNHGDRDSVGLFQQRPSMGWGTVAELTDPATAARKFYTALAQVPGWEQMPVTQAAQTVQRSAFPLAYARWEPLATRLAGSPTSSAACSVPAGMNLPQGAVGTMLRVALAQLGEPYVWGATGPDSFDCSGLIVYSWGQAGYRLTIRTADQMYQASSRVSPGQERAGDLLFTAFGTRVAGAGHVMIVLRPGQAVEAPSAGKNVRLRNYDSNDPAFRFGRLPGSVLQPTNAAA